MKLARCIGTLGLSRGRRLSRHSAHAAPPFHRRPPTRTPPRVLTSVVRHRHLVQHTRPVHLTERETVRDHHPLRSVVEPPRPLNAAFHQAHSAPGTLTILERHRPITPPSLSADASGSRLALSSRRATITPLCPRLGLPRLRPRRLRQPHPVARPNRLSDRAGGRRAGRRSGKPGAAAGCPLAR